ncbi:MAG: vWA domain-containing protein [Planctomycetota bacterium]
MAVGPMLSSPWWLLPGLAVTAWLLWRRLPWTAVVAVLLTLALSGPTWRYRATPTVAVFIDLSPSTRGADWSEPQQLTRLLDGLPANVSSLSVFGESAVETTLDEFDGTEIPARSTALIIDTGADAAVVLTDGLLDLTSNVDTHFLVDPALDDPADTAAVRLQRDGNRLLRQIRFGRGLRGEVVEGTDEATQLSAGDGTDRWPENDVLTLPPAVGDGLQRLVIGGAMDGFDQAEPMTPALLRRAGVVVVRKRIDTTTGDLLRTFVTDLGGNIVWATHELPPMSLRPVLPLSYQPPEPREPWTLLVDVSGSTARLGNAMQRAVDAAANTLPDATPVDVIAFSDRVFQLADGVPADTLDVDLPEPSGPTNLDAAIEAALSKDGRRQLLVLVDAEAELSQQVVTEATNADVTVHVLSPAGTPTSSIDRLVRATGGRLLIGDDLVTLARDLVGDASAGRLQSEERTVVIAGRTATVAPWREAWPKDRATPIGEGDLPAATWRVGAGRATAVSASLPAAMLASMAEDGGGRMVDVRWVDGPELVVTAADLPTAERVELTINGRTNPMWPIAADTFRTTIAGAREPGVAVITVDGQTHSRKAVAGRYEPEFEAIGNDIERLLDFADRFDGDVQADPAKLSIAGKIVTLDLILPIVLLAAMVAVTAAVRGRP